MEIRIPLISYGKLQLIDGDYETLTFEKDYLRVRGYREYTYPKDDDEFIKEDCLSDYDTVLLRPFISCISMEWDAEDKVYIVVIYGTRTSTQFEFETRLEAVRIHEKILRWYFEGIVE